MNNRDVAAVLEEVADLLEFQQANPFRVRAYRNAGRTVRDLAVPIASLVGDPDHPLSELKGIGKDLADKIETLVASGSLPFHQELLAEIPESVLALLRIPGLGPKKAAALYRELHITSLEMLREACEAQQVRKLKGFAAKTEEMILAGISVAEQAERRILWAAADEIVVTLRRYLGEAVGVVQLEFAGSYRRGRETVGDLDVLVQAERPEAVMDRLAAFPEVQDVLLRGDTKMSVRLTSGLQIDLRVVPAGSFGAALQYFTGSKEHNVVLRGLARELGLKINEYGVYRVGGGTGGSGAGAEQEVSLAGASEPEVYASLGLPWIPPELRESRQEFEWAAAGTIPDLIEVGDIRGDLHVHTTASDGLNTAREMATAARARNLSYIAITDHSQRVSMAHGLDAERLLQQWRAIDALNREFDDLTVLKGIECDILEKGGMDLPDEILAQGDWVIASVHYGQKQSRQQITERILAAIENPHVSIIAHPTGRLIQKREPYEVDLQQVFAAASKWGKLLEINASPLRLDLSDIHAAEAKKWGIPLVISTDAHRVTGLDDLRYGVLQARRAGLTKKDVANTLSWPDLRRLVGRVD